MAIEKNYSRPKCHQYRRQSPRLGVVLLVGTGRAKNQRIWLTPPQIAGGIPVMAGRKKQMQEMVRVPLHLKDAAARWIADVSSPLP